MQFIASSSLKHQHSSYRQVIKHIVYYDGGFYVLMGSWWLYHSRQINKALAEIENTLTIIFLFYLIFKWVLGTTLDYVNLYKDSDEIISVHWAGTVWSQAKEVRTFYDWWWRIKIVKMSCCDSITVLNIKAVYEVIPHGTVSKGKVMCTSKTFQCTVWWFQYVFSEMYLQTHEVQVIEPLAAVLSSRDPAALLGTTSSDGTCNCMGSDFSHFFRHKCFISDLFEWGSFPLAP